MLTYNKNLHRISNLVVLSLIIVCFLVIYFNTSLVENFQKENPSQNSLNKDITNKTVQVQENNPNYSNVGNITIGISPGISDKFAGVSELKNINNTNTIITYNFNGRPNINNVTIDLLNEIAITDEINIENCINVDQLAVNYQTKTCASERCYDRFGNKINNGQIIQEMVPRLDIERCTNQSLGYLSFNFSLNPTNKLVRNQTLFMNIETIYLGKNKYATLIQNKNLDYYFRRNLFIEDNYIDADEIIPRIVHSRFSRNNYQQKIIIKRYNQSGTSNVKGSLAELFFRPGQMFLTSKTVGNGIGNINNGNIITGNNNLTNNFAVRVVKQNDNTSSKCVLHPKGIYIIDSGSNYNEKLGVSIQGDNGTFTGNFSITTNQFTRSLRMNFRTGISNKNRAVWLLAEPTNFSPQGITKNNKLSSGYILDYSNQSGVENLNKAVNPNLIPSYSRVGPGTIISPINFNFLPKNSIGSTTIYNLLTNKNCTQLINPVNGNTYNDCKNVIVDNNPIDYYKNFTYLFNGEIETNIFQDNNSSFKLNTDIYSKYPSHLLKAVNKFPAFADPVNLTTQGKVFVFVYQYEDDILGQDYQVSVGVSSDLSLITQNIEDNIILDGAVNWQLINPFSTTFAFRNEYFFSPALLNDSGRVTKISNLKNNTTDFVEPIYGKISSVDISSLDYSQVDLPNFNTSKTVLLDTTTLSVDNGIGKVGKDATCLVTFIKEGTSIVINSLQVVNVGQDFQSGTFSLSASALLPSLTGSINNLNITSIDDSYDFEAIAVSDGKPISGTTVTLNQNFDITYGLKINPIKNQKISLIEPSIINGGYNYTASGASIYINQYNNDGSVFGVSFDQDQINETNMKKLPYLNVLHASQTGVSTFQPAPPPLFSSKISGGICYNFWEDSPAIYSNSPQQIIFYGDFINGTSGNYNGDPTDNLYNFFLNNKIDNSAFTEIEFLTSLQIPSYYYQNKDTTTFPEIESYEGLQLKRFIPYSEFTPPEFNLNEFIPTNTGNITYVNYNYCQFIPFGIKNFYNKQFNSIEDVPNF